VPEWTLAVVLEMDSNSARIGLRPAIDLDGRAGQARVTGALPGSAVRWVSQPLSQLLDVRDGVYVEPVAGEEGVYTLRQVPEMGAGIGEMGPRTGGELARVGGLSFAEREFNRATPAMRKPGSSFKPTVYAAALDNGYTPASVVLDAPLE